MIDLRGRLSIMTRRVGRAHVKQLFFSSAHPPHLTRHRAETISSRVRMVAAVFSVLTVAWIIPDRVALPWPGWAVLAGLRLLAAAIFIALAVVAPRNVTRARAMTALAILLAAPLMLFLAAQPAFSGVATDGAAGLDARLYATLPLIIIAGLGIFPLTVTEGLAFTAPVIAAATLGPMLATGFDWVAQTSNLWTLLLVLGVFLLESMIQLHYMINLLRRASQDVLTDAFTRQSGEEIIEAQFSQSCRQNAPFALAFVDLDNFKSVNDGYGHEAGDIVLKTAVATLGRLLRRSDVIIRWGGEEFVVLLGGATVEGQRITMRRILGEGLGVRPDGRPVTASIGVAERIADGGLDWPDLIELADKRMYRAKVGGRARCVLGDDEVIIADAAAARPINVSE